MEDPDTIPVIIHRTHRTHHTLRKDFFMNEAWAKAKTNRMVLVMNAVICAALTAGYLIDLARGRKTALFVGCYLVAVALQLGISLMAYRRDKTSGVYRYVSLIGYLLLYSIVMFSSDSAFTYVYIFPMFVLYALYYDGNFIKGAGSVIFVLNLGKIGYQVAHGHTDTLAVSAYIVQVAAIGFFIVSVYYLGKLSIEINEDKIQALMESSRSVSELAQKAKARSQVETGLVRSIAEVVPAFVSASKQISDGAQMLASGTVQQSASVDKLSFSVGEINTMAHDNVERSGRALAGVLEAGDMMAACTGQMGQMLEAMALIEEKSRSILRTTKVIDDIAFQTNILALNAAVEAARAGQHGKGFAVVAEEVRNLASKSAAAAKETSQLLESSSKSIEEGNRIAERVSESLRAVAATAQHNAEEIKSARDFSAAQSTAIEEVNTGIEQVAQVISQNSATAQESAASSQQMNALALYLEQLLSEFQRQDADIARRPDGTAPVPAPASVSAHEPYRLPESQPFGKY